MESSSDTLEESSSDPTDLSSDQTDLSSDQTDLSSETSLSSESSSSSEAVGEIEVNDTDDGEDDLVRLKSLIPDKRFKTPCRVRLTKRRPGLPVWVGVSNPDGRLRFHLQENDPPATGLDIELPASGEWKSFWISGEKKSNALRDAVIRVKRGNRVLAICPVTVFYFEPSDITVGRGGAYVLDHGFWGTFAPPFTRSVVNYSASAVIKPDNVNCSAPQLIDLYIGIVQNVSNVRYVARYKDPKIAAWDPTVVDGTEVEVPLEIDVITSFAGPYLDANPDYHPQYQIGNGDDPVQKPVGCGGKKATTRDTPSSYLYRVYPPAPLDTYPAKLPNGVRVAGVKYETPVKISIKAHFITWVVTFRKTQLGNYDFFPLRQTEWSLDVDSSRPSSQHATTSTADHAVTSAPELREPYANDENNNELHPENVSKEPVGTETVTFTKQP